MTKIEHGAPITPEVASFILGKMGSALQINVVDKSGFNSEESDFVVSVINNFADEIFVCVKHGQDTTLVYFVKAEEKDSNRRISMYNHTPC